MYVCMYVMNVCMYVCSLYKAAAFRIIMITGDNPATAAAVGRMAGAFMGPHEVGW